jgi:hypothetical protein
MTRLEFALATISQELALLIAALGLGWVVAQRTELAVHGDPCNVLIFPARLVGKRFHTREKRFVAPLLTPICEDVRRVRAEERPN